MNVLRVVPKFGVIRSTCTTLKPAATLSHFDEFGVWNLDAMWVRGNGGILKIYFLSDPRWWTAPKICNV